MDSTGAFTQSQRRHRTRRALFVLALIAAVGIAGVAATAVPSPAAATEVIGDDDRDMFVGSGSLILPSTVYRPGRESAAQCPGCEWKATLACDPVSPTACRGQARLCPDHHFWLRIWLRRPGTDFVDIGSGCFGPGGPASRERVESTVADLTLRGVPPLQPAFQPAAGVLTHLPVAFSSGQPNGPLGWRWMIAGLPVDVTATPSWRWAAADGGGFSTAPAAAPSADVARSFPRAGIHTVTVATTWRATYVVDGLGPLAVSQPITQAASLDVPVGQARAVLIR